ncbi:RHS repeat-associated core domain-containing protein, partial [Chryseobacterium sp.]|uniref:RHS repeat-associated core domain-containing protein n=2 Tax=unclassified Chryseobacterium TaxID=2593645 RepID=UPI003340C71D
QTIGYDGNGNMTSHLDKGFTAISYNFLNLPSKITHTNTANTLQYVYAANGSKVQMIQGAEITDYLGSFQYTYNGVAVSSQILANEEGYYDFVNRRYVYQYKDHLGNIRVSYTKKTGGGTTILEENNYYAFGLKHGGYNTGDTTNNKFKYLYNRKELQSNGNLDYGWRQYMPDLGRWNGMDQLAENYLSTSPYAYVANNPVLRVDVDGRWFNQDGSIDTSGITPGFTSGKQMYQHFLGQYPEQGGGSGYYGGYNFTGKEAGSIFNYFKNGGSMSELSFDNNYVSWWTGGALGDANTAQEMIGHMMKLSTSPEDSSLGIYSPLSQGNTLLSFNGVYMSNLPYRRYIGTARRNAPFTYRGVRYYGNGRTFLKSESLINVKGLIRTGKILGPISVGVGIILDYGYGVKEYERDPNSPNAVHPRKADLNTTMGIYGLTGVGTIPSLLYFGVDSFYPGGWEGYGNDYQSIQSQNAAIIPGFITAPYGSQKF